MAIQPNSAGFYVFHQKDWANGPMRLTDDAVRQILSSGGSIPKGAALTPTAWQLYKEMTGQINQPAPPPGPDITDYGGGYGSDGGGYGAVAPPRPELASSPEWLAYLNSLGLEQNQFEADIARQRGQLTSESQRQIDSLTPQYQRQRRDLTAGLQDRGMLRSGERLRRDAESRANQGQQVSGIQAALSGQLSGLESQLAQKLIDINARRADRELQLRSQGYV